MSGWPAKITNESDIAEAKRHLGEYETIARLAEEDLAPAEDREIVVIVEKMLSRYHPQKDLAAILAGQSEEWLEDLEGWPVDLIALAYRNWRLDPSREFAPRDAGSLMASVQDILTMRRIILRRAQQIPQILQQLSEEDFDPATRVTADQIAKIDVKVKGMPQYERQKPKHEQIAELMKDAANQKQKIGGPKLSHKEALVAVSLGKFFRWMGKHMKSEETT